MTLVTVSERADDHKGVCDWDPETLSSNVEIYLYFKNSSSHQRLKHFHGNSDTLCVWEGVQSITKDRSAPPACDSDTSRGSEHPLCTIWDTQCLQVRMISHHWWGKLRAELTWESVLGVCRIASGVGYSETTSSSSWSAFLSLLALSRLPSLPCRRNLLSLSKWVLSLCTPFHHNEVHHEDCKGPADTFAQLFGLWIVSKNIKIYFTHLQKVYLQLYSFFINTCINTLVNVCNFHSNCVYFL